jgi:hypothetical protein
MAKLSLDLFLEKNDFVHGESIRFVATLTNRGAAPATLLSMSELARSLTIRITDAEGVVQKADAQNLTEREGEEVPHVRSDPEMTLAPGQKAQETGDVIPWLGEVPPGTYTISAAYVQDSNAWAESTPATITVKPADPARAVPSLPSAIFAMAPRLSTWLNRNPAGTSLFLLATSQNLPSVALSNRSLLNIPGESAVYPSSANANPPLAGHLVWIEGGSVLRSLRLPTDAAPDSPVDVPLPTPGLRIVGRPFSDEKGVMWTVLTDAGGGRATLVKLAPGVPASATPINPAPAMSGCIEVQWSRDEQLILLWTGDDGREIHGALTALKAPANPLTGRRLFTAPQPVMSIKSYIHYDLQRETYTPKCVALCHNQALDMFLSVRVNLATGAMESKEEFIADGLGELTVLQAEVDGNNRVAYLMKDPDGHVYYAPPNLANTKKQVLVEAQPYADQPEVPIETKMSPMLFAAGRLSNKPGFYLRFIENGTHFTTRKL